MKTFYIRMHTVTSAVFVKGRPAGTCNVLLEHYMHANYQAPRDVDYDDRVMRTEMWIRDSLI